MLIISAFLFIGLLTIARCQLNLLHRKCDKRSSFESFDIISPANSSTITTSTIDIDLKLVIINAAAAASAIRNSHYCVSIYSLPNRTLRWEHCGYHIEKSMQLNVNTGLQEIVVVIIDILTGNYQCMASATVTVVREGWNGCCHVHAPTDYVIGAQQPGASNPFMKKLQANHNNDFRTSDHLAIDIFVSVPFLQIQQGSSLADSQVNMKSQHIDAFLNLQQQLSSVVDELSHVPAKFSLTVHFVVIRPSSSPTMLPIQQEASPDNCKFSHWAQWVVSLFQSLASLLIYECDIGVDCTVFTAMELRRNPDDLLLFVSIADYELRVRSLVNAVRTLQRTTVCFVISNNLRQLHGRSKFRRLPEKTQTNYLLMDYDKTDGTQWLLFEVFDWHYWDVSELLLLASNSSNTSLPFIGTTYGNLQYFASATSVGDLQYVLSPLFFVLEYLRIHRQVSITFPMPSVIKRRIYDANEIDTRDSLW